MNVKSLISLVVFYFLINSVLIAQSVDIRTAQTIAEHHLSSLGKVSLKSSKYGKGFHSTSVMVTRENVDTLFYIVNDTINERFVIVSADKRAWPILAYSTEGCFNPKQQNEAFTAWMDNKKKEIESIKTNNLSPDSATTASWTRLSSNNSITAPTSVEPLIKTQWGQGCFYNELCPADNQSYYCGHTPTGCVATAMAQIMKYWNYPSRGKGSNSYSYGIYGVLSADFGATTYEWSKMPNSLTGSNDAVATLMYHCGIASFMGYSSNFSGTNLWPDAIIDFFDYSSQSRLINKKDYSSEAWADVLKSELDLGHPIYYTTSYPSHAFICDGYQGDNYFHFNWGWDGASDGYYYLNSLNPELKTLETTQTAIVKITPNHLPDGYKGIILSTNSLALNPGESVNNPIRVTVNSSSNWTAQSNQEWLSLNTDSGVKGSTILNLSATENATDTTRKAIVTIIAEGFDPQVILIKQFPRFKVTAGGLKNILGNELSSITNLTLSGVIDARDFKTMRDLMPSLESVDLSKVTIKAYSGFDGPFTHGEMDYPANTVPKFAFSFGLRGENTRLMSLVLPQSAIAIGSLALNSCMSLNSLSLPPSLQSIGEDNFNNCSSLKSIFIPSSVKTIGNQIYGKTLITVDDANPNYMSEDGVFYNKAQTILIHCYTSKGGAFNIPETVTTIGFSAFMNCLYLTSITIPQTVNSIEAFAFAGCIALTSVSIPKAVNQIGVGAFLDCRSLTSITIGNPIPLDLAASTNAFFVVDKNNCTLNVPYNTATLYRAAFQWNEFKNIVETPGLFIDTEKITLTETANSTATITLKANLTWTADSDKAWLTVGPLLGSGDQVLTLTALENTSREPRIAIVTFTASNGSNQSIFVTQKAKVSTGADPLSTHPDFLLYPNPTSGRFRLMFDRIPLSGITVTITDLTGRDCLKQLIFEKEAWFNLQGNLPGIYLIKTDQENIKIQKLILH